MDKIICPFLETVLDKETVKVTFPVFFHHLKVFKRSQYQTRTLKLRVVCHDVWLTVWVDFLDNFLDVDLGGVQTEGSKNVSNLIGIYLPVPSLVKQGEGVPEFCDSGGVRDQGQ